MSVCHEIRPALAEQHSRVKNGGRPRKRSRNRIEEEPISIHTRESCGERNEGTHDGQHPAEKDRLETVAVEPALRHVHMGLLDEEIFPVFLHERAAAVRTDLIGKNRAEQTAGHARSKCSLKRHMTREDEIARKAENELTRNGNTGVLRRHQKGDGGIAPRCDKREKNLIEILHRNALPYKILESLQKKPRCCRTGDMCLWWCLRAESNH